MNMFFVHEIWLIKYSCLHFLLFSTWSAKIDDTNPNTCKNNSCWLACPIIKSITLNEKDNQ